MTPPNDPDARRPLVPPHIAWPAFVIFLLTLSVSMAFVTLYVARADGGARVVETAPADTTATDSASGR